MKGIKGIVVAGLGLAGLVGFAKLVDACSGSIYDSVHYNDAQPDFGAPPSRVVITAWEESPSRPVPDAAGWDDSPYDEAKEKATTARVEKLRKEFEEGQDYSAVEIAARSLVKEEIEDRESIREAGEIARIAKAPFPLFREYIAARKDPKGEAKLATLAANAKAGILRDYAAYGLAALKYDDGKYDDAAKAYETVAAHTKVDELRQTALIMAVRTRLRGVLLDSGKWKISPASLEAGTKDIAMLRADYPKSRFIANAYNWETRTLYLEGKPAEAFLRYLSQLDMGKDYESRVNAISSLDELKGELKGITADKVREGLLNSPELLQPYLEYRLYHSRGDVKKDLANLAKLAKAVLDKKPNAALSAGILARLAEIAYLQGGDYETADEWATESLKTEASNKEEARRDLATFVLASAQLKERLLDKAAENYKKLFEDYEHSYLVGAARENLALIHEQKGEWGKALDLYRALNYRFDIATLVDVRMSIEELQQYVASHQEDPELAKFKYALGMRYLRKDNLDEAERWFKDISEAKRKELSEAGSHDYAWLDDGKSAHDQLADPLDTIRDLRDLRGKITGAGNANDKAAAQYALASYWYERRNLLLYNPSLWSGGRSVLAGFWDAGVDKAGYAKAIEEHHYEHECLWKARKLCVVLAKETPTAPVAAKALYRAACAARRLADFNPYWRTPKIAKPLWNECVTLMERVAKEYPNDALAKNATKYGKVFKEERDGTSRQAMFELK